MTAIITTPAQLKANIPARKSDIVLWAANPTASLKVIWLTIGAVMALLM